MLDELDEVHVEKSSRQMSNQMSDDGDQWSMI